jgi:hypothetical protein
MKHAAAIIILVFASEAASAQAPQPIVRANLQPAEQILVGQPVRLIVEVLVPNYFTASPVFPEFELENAIVMLPQETPQNFSEQVAGTSYAGIRTTYRLYPEQLGQFLLPPAQITVTYADVPPHSAQATLQLPQLNFRAEIPPAAEGLDYFLPTAQLKVEQKWGSSLKNLRAGETVERTVTITADKLQGMFIPPLSFDVPDGLRVYPQQPVVENQKSDRGEFLGGQRVESAKYLIERPGDYTLPGLEIKWWDLNANRVRTEVLPAVHFSAASDSAYVPELPPQLEQQAPAQEVSANPWYRYRRWIRYGWIWVVGALVIFWLTVRMIPRTARWVRDARRKHRESEGTYFRALILSCSRNDGAASYRHLLRWLERSRPGENLDVFVLKSGDAELARQIEELGAAVYSPVKSVKWSGSALAQSLKKRRYIEVAGTHRSYRLPKLNPVRQDSSVNSIG